MVLKVISSTVPERSPTVIKSPISKGLSDIIEIPAKKLFAISCAARAITTLLIPRPVANPPKS